MSHIGNRQAEDVGFDDSRLGAEVEHGKSDEGAEAVQVSQLIRQHLRIAGVGKHRQRARILLGDEVVGVEPSLRKAGDPSTGSWR